MTALAYLAVISLGFSVGAGVCQVIDSRKDREKAQRWSEPLSNVVHVEFGPKRTYSLAVISRKAGL